MNRYNRSDKVREGGATLLQSKRLENQVCERIRYLHYSLQAEIAYAYWVRFFVIWSGSQVGMRHPREMGTSDVKVFLTHVVTDRKVTASTHKQAFRAAFRIGGKGPLRVETSLSAPLLFDPDHCFSAIQAETSVAIREDASGGVAP